MNYFFEGLKIQSLLYLLAQPMLIFSELTDDDTYKGMGLGFFIALSITAMTLVLFFSESSNVPIRGRFDPGFREVALTDKMDDSIQMSVFYPIPKKKSRFQKDRGENPKWCPNDARTISGLFDGSTFKKQAFDYVRYSKIKAEKDVDIADEFEEKKIPVLIFSHGVRGHRNMCSGFCREFASQGFAVFSLEHNDHTTSSWINEESKQVEEYKQEDMEDLGLWQPRLE